MTSPQLKITEDVLGSLQASASNAQTLLSTTSDAAGQAAAAVGYGPLASKLDGLSSAWSYHRKQLIGSLAELANDVMKARNTLADTDTNIVTQLCGPSQGPIVAVSAPAAAPMHLSTSPDGSRGSGGMSSDAAQLSGVAIGGVALGSAAAVAGPFGVLGDATTVDPAAADSAIPGSEVDGTPLDDPAAASALGTELPDPTAPAVDVAGSPVATTPVAGPDAVGAASTPSFRTGHDAVPGNGGPLPGTGTPTGGGGTATGGLGSGLGSGLGGGLGVLGLPDSPSLDPGAREGSSLRSAVYTAGAAAGAVPDAVGSALHGAGEVVAGHKAASSAMMSGAAMGGMAALSASGQGRSQDPDRDLSDDERVRKARRALEALRVRDKGESSR